MDTGLRRHDNGPCPPLTLPRFARAPPSPRRRGEGWGEGRAPADQPVRNPCRSGTVMPESARETSVKPAPFAYHRPATIADAVQMLAELAPQEGRVLAGGQS